MLEVRAGTGGDEASIWRGIWSECIPVTPKARGWRVKLLSESTADMGGFKEAILEIIWDQVYSKLKFEAGVHRVQRVPVTEAGGRVHTSTATVAVMPEVDDVEVEIDPKDIELTTARSAVRVVRTSTRWKRLLTWSTSRRGISDFLYGRTVPAAEPGARHADFAGQLYEMKLREQQEAVTSMRRSQVGRVPSEKIEPTTTKNNRLRIIV